MKWHRKRKYIKRRSLTVIHKTRIERGADGVTCCRYQQRLLKLVYMRLLQQETGQYHTHITAIIQWAETRMIRWMCNVKVKDRVPSKELRERLGIDEIILTLQQNTLRWYGHVLWKEDTDWVKKCMEYEVEGSRPRGRPKRTWREVVQKDCQARNLNKEDAMDRGRWKKLIKIGWWSGWWVGECFFWYQLTRVVPDKGP